MTNIISLKDDLWFPLNQPTLLHMVNGPYANYGRQLLNIDLNIPLSIPITKITKCSVTARIGERQWVSDFRIGAKWGNVVRHRPKEYKELENRIEREFWKEQRFRDWQRGFVAVGGGQDTFFPDPNPETDTFDGYTARSVAAGETWATMRGSTTGTLSSSTAADLWVGIQTDGVLDGDDWDTFIRSFILVIRSSAAKMATMPS